MNLTLYEPLEFSECPVPARFVFPDAEEAIVEFSYALGAAGAELRLTPLRAGTAPAEGAAELSIAPGPYLFAQVPGPLKETAVRDIAAAVLSAPAAAADRVPDATGTGILFYRILTEGDGCSAQIILPLAPR